MTVFSFDNFYFLLIYLLKKKKIKINENGKIIESLEKDINAEK